MANKPVIKKPEINEEKIKEALDSKFGTDYERFLIAAGAQNDYCYKEMLRQTGEVIEQQIWKSAYITPTNKQRVINGIKQVLSQLEE